MLLLVPKALYPSHTNDTVQHSSVCPVLYTLLICQGHDLHNMNILFYSRLEQRARAHPELCNKGAQKGLEFFGNVFCAHCAPVTYRGK